MAYRSVNPRPLRDVSGDVVLVTGAGESEKVLKELQVAINTTESEYYWLKLSTIVYCLVPMGTNQFH